MSTDTSPKPPRWRWAVLGLLVVGALSVPTGIVYLRHQLQARPDDSARPWDNPEVANKLTDARLVKAKAIREEWRPWAIKHKALLKAMLASQGKDFSTLQAVYKVSPPIKDGDWQPDTQSGPTKFNWFIDDSKRIQNGMEVDAQYKAQVDAEKPSVLKKLQTDFASKSDYMVAVSQGVGSPVYVWASGRVTELFWIDNPDKRAGQPTDLGTDHKELLPPYDFLTSAKLG